jgi:hypothetical protein
MARYPRLKLEHIQPADAPISRAGARRLLVEYLVQVVHWPAASAEGGGVRFDLLADDQDRHHDEEFQAATREATREISSTAEEIQDLRGELQRSPESAAEGRALQADLKLAVERIARCRATIAVAEAKRAAAKADYRKLLVKLANQIASEAEEL